MPGMEIWESVKHVRANIKPCQNWEQLQVDKEAQRTELEKRDFYSPSQLEHAKNKGEVIINITNKLNQYSDNKSQNVATGTFYLGLLIKLPLILTAGITTYLCGKRDPQSFTMPALAAFILPSIPLVLWSTEKQKEASKVAKYQAKEKVFKNPRNFVIYTPEQIEQAKKIAYTMPDKPEKDIVEKFTKSINSLIQDRKDYRNWKEENIKKEIERQKLFDTVPLSEEQTKDAKDDQDLIFRTINRIDKKAKEYSFNTEMIADIILSLPIFTAGIVTKGLEKIGVYGDSIKNIKVLELGNFSFKATEVFSGIILMVFAMPLVQGLKKNAAQIGRFKAKQELMSNPYNFVNYDDKEFDSVKDVKGKKVKTGFFQDLINDIKFLPTVLKDSIKYKNYKKTEGQFEAKYKKALDQVAVTQQQLEDAKKLQAKLFRTFDKMDDSSQKYSQDIEGATSLVKCVIEEVGIFVVALGAVLYTYLKSKNTNPKAEVTPLPNKISYIDNLAKRASLDPQTLASLKKTSKIAVGLAGTIGGIVLLQCGLSWLKKQAARIGIMKATQEMSDYRNFADL